MVKQLSFTKGTASYPNISQMKLQAFENKVKYEQQYVVFLKNEMSHKFLPVAKKKGTSYITQKQKSFAVGRPVKYALVTSFVRKLVQLRWESGNSLSKALLYESIIGKYSSLQCDFNSNVLKSKNYPNSMHKFVERTLKAINFITRKSSLLKKFLITGRNLL